jgi:suppressor of fused-like protein
VSGARIDRHVDRCDGGPPRTRFRPRPPRGSRVAPPLEEVTLHQPTAGEWHLVTRGLTELGPKESEDRGRSGWGFELTLRLEVEEDEPDWAVDLLTNLAAYVWTSGHPFAPGHHLDLGGPIRLGTDTALRAATIVRDPVLGAIKTANGSVEFLQVVGLTADELEACRAWRTDGVVGHLARADPHLVTRLGRPSALADPAVAAEVAQRSGSEGSSLTELRVASLRWWTRRVGGTVLTLGAGASAALGPALRRELVGPGASFVVTGDDAVARFTVADTSSFRTVGEALEIAVAPSQVEPLAALFDGRTGRGRLPALAGLHVVVVA